MMNLAMLTTPCLSFLIYSYLIVLGLNKLSYVKCLGWAWQKLGTQCRAANITHVVPGTAVVKQSYRGHVY